MIRINKQTPMCLVPLPGYVSSKDLDIALNITRGIAKKKYKEIFNTKYDDKKESKRLWLPLRGTGICTRISGKNIDDIGKDKTASWNKLWRAIASFKSKDQRIKKPSILYSKPNCPEQLLHYDTEDARILSVIVALQEGTCINMVSKEGIKSQIAIPPGWIAIFSGTFPHGGSFYEKENTRLHCFFAEEHQLRNNEGDYVRKLSMCPYCCVVKDKEDKIRQHILGICKRNPRSKASKRKNGQK